MFLAKLLLGAVWLLSLSDGAKILGVIPTGGRSHHIVGVSYMRALAEAGHDVTVLGAYPEKNPPKNYRDIELTGIVEALFGTFVDLFSLRDASIFDNLIMMYTDFGRFTSEFTFNHSNVQRLLNSGETFDAVIVETFLTEAIYGMAQHFNASLITYSPFGSSMWTTGLTRSPAPSSHVTSFMLEYLDKMTFRERLWNTIIDWLDRAMYRGFHLPSQRQIYEQAFPNARISFDEQMRSVSLVLLNDHFSLGSARPYHPNMIEVGGIQIEKVKPLPKDLQKFLDEATDGVIYFSMGSYLKSKDLPVEKRNAFIKVFSRLKQRVIWKFEDESIPNLPKNLLIKAWMPQNDILAHPNVRLFITHGGLLGSTEALYHAIPVIGIPIFGDQRMNIQRAVRTGYGVLLDLNDVTEQSVQKAVEEVLTNPSYTDRARLISARYRDKPMSPKETAVFWIEYVIRHQGAPHIRSPAVDLTLLEYNLVDVYLTLAGLPCTIAALIYWAIKRLHRAVRKYWLEYNKKRD